MRITQHGLVEQVINNLSNRLNGVAESQERVSSGLRVSKPSDDPTAASEISNLNSEISRINQYYRNVQSGISTLKMTETALSEIKDIIIQSRAKALQGSNDTLKPEDRAALADEIDQLIGELLRIANQKSGGKYLFAGTESNKMPYKSTTNENGELIGVTTQLAGEQNDIELQFGDNERIATSVTAQDTFDLGDGANLFDILFNLKSSLENTQSNQIGEALPKLDLALDQLNAVTALVGTRVKSAENLMIQYDSREINLTERLSDLADVDIVDAITRMNEEEYSYELALKVAAQVIQPSLVNFISL
ncbi:flagellar hook-associated protein FlgL [bacterium]|nr:flagellar hook-associated protein FlgL [bacterium]